MSNGLDRPAVSLGIGESFDAVVLPHLDAAHRLARWLMRDADVAEDAVQEASLRAFRYFRTFVGGDGRAWFLRIVRNTCYGWRLHRYQPPTDSFDEEQHSSARPQSDPEALLLQTDDATLIAQALSRLPDHYHQLIVLRELEGLSYQELSDVIGIPKGTVMSRLSRAREALRSALNIELPQSGISSRSGSRTQEARVAVKPDSHARRKPHDELRHASRHRSNTRVAARRAGTGHHAAAVPTNIEVSCSSRSPNSVACGVGNSQPSRV